MVQKTAWKNDSVQEGRKKMSCGTNQASISLNTRKREEKMKFSEGEVKYFFSL